MEKFVWVLDENLKLMVVLIGKYLALLTFILIATQVFSNNEWAAYLGYVSILFTAIIATMVAGVVIWFVWAKRNCCADGETTLIMSGIIVKVFIAYFVIFGLIFLAMVMIIISGFNQKPMVYFGIALFVIFCSKVDSHLDAYLSNNILDNLQLEGSFRLNRYLYLARLKLIWQHLLAN